MNPFLITSLLFFFVAILAALDAALTHVQLLRWFNGLRWLRVHLVTLGIVTEALFGFIPILVAKQNGRPKPAPRLDIWLLTTAGTIVLMAGIPLVSRSLIFTGGSLIFAASSLLLHQVWQLRGAADSREGESSPRSGSGPPFYATGIAFLLLGILVGTGIWFGGNNFFRMAAPLEVHIHTNSWGFLSLVFAGILIDHYPRFSGLDLAWPNSIRWIYYLMTIGAIGLVLGPWLGLAALTAPGMLLHLCATIWLLLNLGLPLRHHHEKWTAGMVHIFAAYLWIIAPLLFAPFILTGAEDFPVQAVENNAPQALIYGWALQLCYALVPYLYARFAATSERSSEDAELGGTRWSVAAVNFGCLMLFAGIFLEAQRPVLHGTAYLAWALSMLPILATLWKISKHSLD